jgi:endonuclease/exonuclease/phosphatase family metal-dependent hydrolase
VAKSGNASWRFPGISAYIKHATVPEGGNPPGPDILCLEEIENEKVLEALRKGPLAAARYGYAAIAPSEGGPFSVCVLSRLPILSSSCHYASTPAGRAGRDLLELELDAGGRRLFVLVCHWKSKTEGDEVTEEARREAAALVRDRVALRIAADPAAEILVCGDLNESPDEYLRAEKRYATALMPVEAFELSAGASAGGASAGGASSPGLAPSRILVASTRALTVPHSGENVLFSPWQESGGYSYSYKGSRDRIDNFLLSPGLLDASGLSFKSFSASEADSLMDADGTPIAWPGSGASGFSDHLPILLILGIEKGS